MRLPVLLLACLILNSCSADTDGDPSTVPQITDVQFRSQSGDDGEKFNFTIFFRDTDGNLAGGILTFKAGDEAAESIPLQVIFDNQTPPLASESVDGEFNVTLTYQPEGGITSGARLNFSFTLTDASGQSSAPENLTLVAVTSGGP